MRREKENKYDKIINNRAKYRSDFSRSKRKFKRVAHLGLRLTLVASVLSLGAVSLKTDIERKEIQKTYVPSPKWQKFRSYENTVVAGIAWVEKFSTYPYLCGAGYWTIGYGNRKVNGYDVNANTISINRTFDNEYLAKTDTTKAYGKNYKDATYKRGKEYVIAYLDEEIYPVIDEHVKVPLKENEHVAIIMFMYNIGPKAFINSEFLKALNNGETGVELAKKMTGFRAITKTNIMGNEEKQLSRGLLKREWIIINMFLNPDIETVDENGKKITENFMSYLPKMIPGKFYKEKDMSFYFEEEIGSVGENDYYTPKLDNNTLVKFINKNTHKTNNVGSILDKETREDINKKRTMDLSNLLKKQYNNGQYK